MGEALQRALDSLQQSTHFTQYDPQKFSNELYCALDCALKHLRAKQLLYDYSDLSITQKDSFNFIISFNYLPERHSTELMREDLTVAINSAIGSSTAPTALEEEITYQKKLQSKFVW